MRAHLGKFTFVILVASLTALANAATPSAPAPSFCVEGAAPEADVQTRLLAPPAANVYGSVPEPVECDYSGAGVTSDFTGPGTRCRRICGQQAGTIGGMLVCLAKASDPAFNQTVGAFSDLMGAFASDPSFSVTSPEHGNLAPVLDSDSVSRAPIRVSISGTEFTVDLNSPTWAADWEKLSGAAVARCQATQRQDCEAVRQSAAKFSKKMKLLERVARLDALARSQAGLGEEHVTRCGTGRAAGSQARKASGPKSLRPGTKGSSDLALKQCEDPAKSLMFDCGMLNGLDIAPFWNELRPLITHPGFNVNYIDLLRIRAIAQMLKSHRTVVGEAIDLSKLPPACDTFKKGLKAANTAPNEAEAHEHQSTLSPEYLHEVRDAASKIESVQFVPEYINCHHDGQARACELNPKYDAALEEEKQLYIRALSERYPLLAARVPGPGDLPAAFGFSHATSDEELSGLATAARAKLSEAYVSAIGKLCDNSNDHNHFGLDSGSVSWMDLVTMNGLTRSTVSTPPFGVFAEMQKCLEEQARSARLGRTLASPIMGLGCIGGAMAGGPFVGVPCMGVAALMSVGNFVTKANTLEWTSQCEAASGGGHPAMCGGKEYLDARADLETATVEALMTFGGAAEESARGILAVAAKLRSAPQIRALAAALRAAEQADAGSGGVAHLGELAAKAAHGEFGVEVDLAELGVAQERPAGMNPLFGGENEPPTQVIPRAPKPPGPPQIQLTPAMERQLGITGQVETAPLGKGGLNDVARLKSADPANPAHFRRDPSLDSELWGEEVDKYAVKRGRAPTGATLAGEEKGTLGPRDLSLRDRAVYLKARKAIADNPEKYKNIRMAETHWMGFDEQGRPLVLSRIEEGDNLYKAIAPDIEKIFGRKLDWTSKGQEGKPFFAKLLQGEWGDITKDPQPLRELLPGLLRRYALSDSPENVERVAAILESPDNVRIRQLMRGLKDLGEDPGIVDAHETTWTEIAKRDGQNPDFVLGQRMPWQERVSPIRFDSGPNNFFLQRGPDGQWQVVLFDW